MRFLPSRAFVFFFLFTLPLSLKSERGEAKIRVEYLKQLNVIPEAEEEAASLAYLNPEHGVFFVESGLLENLAQLKVDGVEDQATLKAGELIRALFHPLPSGYTPSDGSAFTASFLHPHLIGKVLGLYVQGEERAQSFIDLILDDKGLKKQLELNHEQYCRLGKLIPELEKKKEHQQDIEHLKKERLFHQVFEDKNHFCGSSPSLQTVSLSLYLKKLRLYPNLKKIASILAEKEHRPNLLVSRALLGLLWHKVKNKQGFALYISGLSSQLKNLNIVMKEGWDTARWQDEDFKNLREEDFAKDFYQALLSEQKGQTLLKQEHVNIDGKSWADCGEASLRNFIRLFAEGEGEEEAEVSYDLKLLRSLGASKGLVAFFSAYKTDDLQLSQEARNAWGLLTCDLPGVSYLKAFGNSRCEINAGADNMLKVIQQLFFVPSSGEDKPKDWKGLGERMATAHKDFTLEQIELDHQQMGVIRFRLKERSYTWHFEPFHFYTQRDRRLDPKVSSSKFLALLERKGMGKELAEWGLPANSTFLNSLELAAFLGKPLSEANEIILDKRRREKSLNKLAFLLDLKSDEAVIQTASRLFETESQLFASLPQRLLFNQDAQTRFIKEVITSDKKVLYALTVFKNIEKLDLEESGIDSKTIQTLTPALKELTHLKTLNLGSNNLGEEEAAFLAPVLGSLTALEGLDLSENTIGERGVKALAPVLRSLTALENLNLSNNTMGERGAAALAPVLGSLTALEWLDLSENAINKRGAKALASVLRSLTALKLLDLAGNNLGKKGAMVLAPALASLAALKSFNFAGNNLGKKGVKALAPALASLTALENLNLSSNTMGEGGAKALASTLGLLRALKNLNLSSNLIGAGGARALAPALTSLTALEWFFFSNNTIGDDGAVALAPALRSFTALEMLDLSSNTIGGERGAKALAPALASLTALEMLDLSNNTIGEEGALALAPALRSLTALIWLRLNGESSDSISQETKTYLNGINPRLSIFY